MSSSERGAGRRPVHSLSPGAFFTHGAGNAVMWSGMRLPGGNRHEGLSTGEAMKINASRPAILAVCMLAATTLCGGAFRDPSGPPERRA